MELVSKLFFNFPGELLRDKIENAHKNLESLQCFIDLKFKDVSRSLYIQKSYSHDVHVKTENNPYEIIRRGIFSLKNQDYLELLVHYHYLKHLSQRVYFYYYRHINQYHLLNV